MSDAVLANAVLEVAVLGRGALLIATVCLAWLPAGAAFAGTRNARSASDDGTIRVGVDALQVQAPRRAHPGIREIDNTSDVELVVVRQEHRGAGRLLADLRHGDRPILAGRLGADFLVIDTVRPHEHVFASLRSGTLLIAERDAQGTTSSDVASIRVAGAHSNSPVPSGPSEVRVSRRDQLDMPNPTYADSALYVENNGTKTVQIRLYRLKSGATAHQLRAFTAAPSWARLAKLPLARSFDLAALAPRTWISTAELPANGRYVAVAAPLVPGQGRRPSLRPDLVASVKVTN